MKITMVGSLPPIKGMSAYCLQLVQALSKSVKIDFISFKHIYPPIIYPIATTEDDKIFKAKLNGNVKVKSPLRWYHPFGAIFQGLKVKNELVHFHWWTSFLFVSFYPLILMAKLKKKKVVCTVHNVLGHESGFIDKFLCKSLLKLPDHYIVHTEKNKERLSEVFGIDPSLIHIIPHGRYDFYIEKPLDRSEAKTHLGYDEDSKIVLFFGQIRDYKGIDLLLKAIALVKDDVPKLKCIIAGKNWVPWENYQEIIDKNNLADIVVADKEYVPSSMVQYLYSAADVVVLPYKKFDSQSGPGNIALGFGRALAVSNVGGLPDLVKNEDVIFEAKDPAKISKIILKILTDDSYRESLESDSRELAEKYDWNIIAKTTAELYDQILNSEN